MSQSEIVGRDGSRVGNSDFDECPASLQSAGLPGSPFTGCHLPASAPLTSFHGPAIRKSCSSVGYKWACGAVHWGLVAASKSEIK